MSAEGYWRACSAAVKRLCGSGRLPGGREHADDFAYGGSGLRSIFFSSAVSLSFTISSIPPAPSRTGTPM